MLRMLWLVGVAALVAWVRAGIGSLVGPLALQRAPVARLEILVDLGLNMLFFEFQLLVVVRIQMHLLLRFRRLRNLLDHALLLIGEVGGALPLLVLVVLVSAPLVLVAVTRDSRGRPGLSSGTRGLAETVHVARLLLLRLGLIVLVRDLGLLTGANGLVSRVVLRAVLRSFGVAGVLLLTSTSKRVLFGQ